MKKQFIILFLLISMHSAIAQPKTKSVDAYAIATAELAAIKNKTALGIGGYAGILLNKDWFIALGGSNLLFKHTVNNSSTRFQFNQYGIYAEKHFFNPGNVRFTTALFAGGGWLNYDSKEAGKKFKRDGDYTYVIQPKIAITVPVFKFMQLQVHTAYRFTGGIKSELFSTGNMNGITAGLSLLLGTF